MGAHVFGQCTALFKQMVAHMALKGLKFGMYAQQMSI
jgi:hypothetical protein